VSAGQEPAGTNHESKQDDYQQDDAFAIHLRRG
jgi:hypothetical protein